MLLVDLRYRRIVALQHRYHQPPRERSIIVCIADGHAAGQQFAIHSRTCGGTAPVHPCTDRRLRRPRIWVHCAVLLVGISRDGLQAKIGSGFVHWCTKTVHWDTNSIRRADQ
eukprot:COSAG02_NODE_37931_length_435_cov_1.372024_1_plen_111_part_10